MAIHIDWLPISDTVRLAVETALSLKRPYLTQNPIYGLSGNILQQTLYITYSFLLSLGSSSYNSFPAEVNMKLFPKFEQKETTNQDPSWNKSQFSLPQQNKHSDLNVYFGVSVPGKATQKVCFVHTERPKKKFWNVTNASIWLKNRHIFGKFKSKWGFRKIHIQNENCLPYIIQYSWRKIFSVKLYKCFLFFQV